MVAGAAGDDLHLADLVEDSAGIDAESLFEHAVFADAARERVADGPGLLVNLLVHEVLVAALVHCRGMAAQR